MGAGRTVSSIPFGFDRYGRPLRTWRRRKDLSLGEALRYPLVDGPGVALLVVFPPFLAFMALPVFDMIVRFAPENALSPINLLIIPFSLPLVISFTLTAGYLLLFLGRVLASSAWGQDDHPRFPIWDRLEILEELARWSWAILTGPALAGLAMLAYWSHCGEVEPVDLVVLAALASAGLAYAPMALMAALIHDPMAAANPAFVARSIARVGRDYVGTIFVASATIAAVVAAWRGVLLHSPSAGLGLLGLWACWVFTLYAGLLLVRVLGTLYYKSEDRLAWFRPWKG